MTYPARQTTTMALMPRSGQVLVVETPVACQVYMYPLDPLSL